MIRIQTNSIPEIKISTVQSDFSENQKRLLSGDQLILKSQGSEIHKQLQMIGDGLIPLPAPLNQDKKMQWIFHSDHKDAHNEYALTAVINDEIIHVVIDRTFIDEKNRRWIVDYKVTEELSIERYRAQLERYASILRLQETREIWLGVYSPLSQAWVEWRYEK